MQPCSTPLTISNVSELKKITTSISEAQKWEDNQILGTYLTLVSEQNKHIFKYRNN